MGMNSDRLFFAPEDISVTQLLEEDRSYAGWLYFNVGNGHNINLVLLLLGELLVVHSAISLLKKQANLGNWHSLCEIALNM